MTKQKQLLLVPAVIATGMMSFAGVLIETAMNVTFPTLINQFQLTTAQVQWVTTIYLLMISIIVPLSTYLTRNFSLRSLFLLSNLLFLAGIIVDFFSPTFFILLLGRLLQGNDYRDCFTTNVPYYFDLCAYEPPRSDDGGGNTDHSNCSGYRANIRGNLNFKFHLESYLSFLDSYFDSFSWHRLSCYSFNARSKKWTFGCVECI